MRKTIDPITFEVIRNHFDYITKMMSQTLQKTSFASTLYDRIDLSSALFDANARLIGQTTNIPAHLAAMNYTVEAAVKRFDGNILEGDIVIINDPYKGGTHNTDATFIEPIYYKGKLLAYGCSRGHWRGLDGNIEPLGSPPIQKKRVYAFHQLKS